MKKIPGVSDLETSIVLNTKIPEVERKIKGVSSLMTTAVLKLRIRYLLLVI